jgi:hypothetical protein
MTYGITCTGQLLLVYKVFVDYKYTSISVESRNVGYVGRSLAKTGVAGRSCKTSDTEALLLVQEQQLLPMVQRLCPVSWYTCS